MVDYTVLVCTYNQCQSLKLVLGYLAKQVVSSRVGYELIVVDNNSTDETRTVCEEAAQNFSFPFRYIFEARQGLSVARNTGLREAAGNIIVFTDDDARIPSDWLQNHIDMYERHSADCVYGRIIIDWDHEKPYWYSDRYKSMFVGLDYGDKEFFVKDHHHEFYGKNFSVRKNLLIEFGGFDEKLGRRGKRLFIGEETKIYKRLIDMGCKVVYTPGAYLFHMLKDYEYSIEHFRKYYNDATLSEYYMLSTSAQRTILGRPAYALRKVMSFALSCPRLIITTLFHPNRQSFLYLRLEMKKHFQLLMLWLRNGID